MKFALLLVLTGSVTAQEVRVGIRLNETEMAFRAQATVRFYRKGRVVRRVPAGHAFRVWLGDGPDGVASEPSPGWYVQAGAFRNPDSVAACKAQLEKITDEEPVVHKRKRFYLVRFGPYESLNDASRTKDLLRMNGFSDAYLLTESGKRRHRPRLFLITDQYDKLSLSDSAVLMKSAAPIQVGGTRYRGSIELRINGNRFNVINLVGLEDYLKGVVPAEMGGNIYPHIEALKAQAVAARTYVYYNRGQFKSLGFDICATQACQVYKGLDVEEERTNRAIEATKGEILTYDGKPINALFTAFCGGHTEDVEHVFDGEAVPYLRGVACVGGDGDWAQKSITARVTPPPVATPYTHRPYLDLVRMTALGLLDAGQYPNLMATVSLDAGRAVLAATLAYLGIRTELPKLPASPMLRDWGSALSQAVFGVSDPDELLRAGLVRQPLAPAPARLMDVVGLCGALLDRMAGPRVDLLRFKIVDERFLADLTDPEMILIDAGDGELPLSTARIRFGDRVRLVEVNGHVAAIMILSRESQAEVNDSFVAAYDWYRYLTVDELTESVNRQKKVGRVLDLEVVERTESGRIAAIRVKGTRGTGIIRGLRVRWALGGREMKMDLFKRMGPDGNLLGVYLRGTAWGHGVGLCQVGAFGMATRGADYRTILKHYYTGVTIEAIQ